MNSSLTSLASSLLLLPSSSSNSAFSINSTTAAIFNDNNNNINNSNSSDNGNNDRIVILDSAAANFANKTDDNFTDVASPEKLEFPAYFKVISMTVCVVILIFGVIGNVMVPIVIFRTKDMRNSTNIFLTNLSVADLLVLLICTPTVLVEVNTKPETWVLGENLCKIIPFVELTVAHASVLTILAITFERYYAICEPLRAGYICTKARAFVICIIAWTVAALCASPMIVISDYQLLKYQDDSLVAVCLTQANTLWRVAFFVAANFLFYIFPFFLLVCCYSLIARRLMAEPETDCSESSSNARARKQVVAMLAMVVITFFLCLLPFRILVLWIILSSGNHLLKLGFYNYHLILYFCRIMIYLNSAVNPLLYNLMSSKFRIAFKTCLTDFCCRHYCYLYYCCCCCCCRRYGRTTTADNGKNHRSTSLALSNTLSTTLSHSSTRTSIVIAAAASGGSGGGSGRNSSFKLERRNSDVISTTRMTGVGNGSVRKHVLLKSLSVDETNARNSGRRFVIDLLDQTESFV